MTRPIKMVIKRFCIFKKCGTSFYVSIHNTKKIFCSDDCRIAWNNNRKKRMKHNET